MSNPVFDLLGKQTPMPGNMGQIMSQFQQFRQAFGGELDQLHKNQVSICHMIASNRYKEMFVSKFLYTPIATP